jgi:hypothetical protein
VSEQQFIVADDEQNLLAWCSRFMQIGDGWVTGNSGDQSMRKLVPGLVVAAVVALSAPAGAVSVMSPTGFAPAVSETSDAMVQQVADGCGRGFHRGPRGRCRPNRAGVVVAPGLAIAPPVVVVPRARWCHRSFSSRNFRC